VNGGLEPTHEVREDELELAERDGPDQLVCLVSG